MRSSDLQPWKGQLTGIGYSTAAQAIGAHCPRNGLWTRSCAARRTTPQSTTPGLHPVIHVPNYMDHYSFTDTLRDGWLNWPCWLTDSGRLNHKVVTHPASSLAQDGESSPVETSVLTTMLRHFCEKKRKSKLITFWKIPSSAYQK